MEFLLHFHVKSNQRDKLVRLLESYSGITSIITSRRTDDLLDNILSDTDADPNYYVINRSSSSWQSVECNSFKKHHCLGRMISEDMGAVFVQTLYCSLGEYTYFLVYDKGKMIREIESTNESMIPRINQGIALPFESKRKGGKRINNIRMFDLDSIADYCLQMGIDISNLWNEHRSIVLRGRKHDNVLYHIERQKLRTLWNIERYVRKITGVMTKRKSAKDN
ncbi:MAG TPA: hypothetical protein PLS00_00200 [Niabella sp.]|nr:hypothetical protein [Niabella sp.]